jgi:hypothetical protein
MELLLAGMEVKFEKDAPDGTFIGYGSTFGNVDLGNDVCAKGCFSRTLKEHLTSKSMPSLYWMHDRRIPIGDWTAMEEDEKGLKATGQLWIGKGIKEAEQAYCMLKGTGKKGLSIGYHTRKSSMDEVKKTRTLIDVDLPEVSVVGYGMNQKALVTHVKSLAGIYPTIRELEDILREVGISASQAKALLASGYKAVRWDGDQQKSEEDREAIEMVTRMRASLH